MSKKIVKDYDKDNLYIFKDNFFVENTINILYYIKEKPLNSFFIILSTFIVLVLFLNLLKSEKFDLKTISSSKIKIKRKVEILNGDFSVIEPNFSEDGKKIIFVKKYKNEYFLSEVNSNGTKEKEYLKKDNYLNNCLNKTNFEKKISKPIFYNNKIIFVSNFEGKNKIYLLNKKTEKVNLLFKTKFDVSSPCLSPDKKSLIFQILINNNYDLWVYNFRTKKIKKLLQTKFDEALPEWSENGKFITYTSNQSGKFEIWIYNFEKKRSFQLTKTIGNSSNSSISPDNKKIIFLSEIDNNKEVFIINSDGSELKRLTFTKKKDELSCRFSKNGEEILATYSEKNMDKIKANLFILEKIKD